MFHVDIVTFAVDDAFFSKRVEWPMCVLAEYIHASHSIGIMFVYWIMYGHRIRFRFDLQMSCKCHIHIYSTHIFINELGGVLT